MILSDRELRTEIQDGQIKFEPSIDLDSQIQDASIDVRLGHTLRVVLANTYKKVTLPLHLAARLDGKSSLARLGLVNHCTSAHIAPGFDGIIVLEIINHGPNTLVLMPQMLIGQLIFEKLSMMPSKAYSGHYRGQLKP